MEEVEARRCKARLEHLASIGLPQKDEATKWNDRRMDRILADYMLRRGYHRSATQLAKERQIEVLPSTPRLDAWKRAMAPSLSPSKADALCSSFIYAMMNNICSSDNMAPYIAQPQTLVTSELEHP